MLESFWKARNFFEVLIYIGLLIGGLLFSLRSVQDYLAGNTSYSLSKEDISLKDLPTLSICLEFYDNEQGWLTYGADFNMTVKISESKNKTVQLVEDESVQTLYSLKFHLSELLPRAKEIPKSGMAFKGSFHKQCYKVSADWYGREELDFQKVTFSIKKI